MPAAGHDPAHPAPPDQPRSNRAALVAAWAQALRQRADAATLQALAPLTDAEAARLAAKENQSDAVAGLDASEDD